MSWYTQSKTEEELVAIISKGGSDFKPGRKAEYSNSNFVLLSYILEKTFNKTYDDLLQEYVVSPIGLENTHFGNKTGGAECRSYSFSGDWKVEPATDMSIPLGAGGIVSTSIDLIRFGDALFTAKIISNRSLEQMKTIKDGYGRGLFQMPFYDKPGYGHTGDIDGFTSIFSYFPNDKIAFALTSNGTNYNNNDIAITVLSAVYNKPFEIPDFTELELTTDDLNAYLGVYSSKQIPIKIAITKNDKVLFAQATGQPSLPLEPTAKDKFRQDKIGAALEFNTSDKTMVLKQGGSEFLFKNEGVDK